MQYTQRPGSPLSMVCQRWPRGLCYIYCDTSGADACRISPEDDETLEARFLGISVFSDRGGFFWAVFWMVIWVLATRPFSQKWRLDQVAFLGRD